jgi:crotonobetainyl-CoA:carnitine CoA-transferase CaiB-like acyl-CoA transferase
MTSLPLSSLLVADFSRILAGPLCSQLLADAGARVIKVEEAGRGDETRRWGPPFHGSESAYFLSLNRNKESLTLNLKSREGQGVAARLIERADVVLNNFSADQQKRFGLSPARVRRLNRAAVHCTITGFDAATAEAGLPGYDLLAQAAGGLMAITGEPDGAPMKSGVALADVLTAHYAHGAILAALLKRGEGGSPQPIEISLFGATVGSLVNVAQNFLTTGREPRRYGNEHASIVPYQLFETADRPIVIAVATDRHFELFCTEVLGTPAADPRYATNASRVEHRETLIPAIQSVISGRRADYWLRRARRAGIPAARVQRFSEIFSADGNLERVAHTTLGEIRLVASPVRLAGRRLPVRTAPPTLGQHTDAILRELGFSPPEIARLRRDGIV